MKKVFKYATGVEVPENSVYLSTQVETLSYREPSGGGEFATVTKNVLVWHYFLVEVEESK